MNVIKEEVMEKSREKHNFTAEVSKVLQLMIHSLYTNRDIFLRELVSNASDACDKLRYAALTDNSLMSKGGELAIHITPDKEAKTITITDAGIGMNRQEMIENLGTIARSGTQEFLSRISGDSKKDANLIGQFGVGFYSSFMAAHRVEVYSRHAGEGQGYKWESEAAGEFTIVESADAPERGTRIVLHLKDEAAEYLDFFRLKHIVQTYSDHVAFPISITNEEGVVEIVNKGSALWARNKNEITPEQYKEFYHHVGHQPDDPWMTLHHKAEGAMEYIALLFVPTIRPFDLFHPDRQRRVKLYVKRVFITDEGIDLIPHWLRFLRGVIDSEDLPLNISRETLQSNPMLAKIRDSVTRKVLQDLNKKAKDDADAYVKFWTNYGAVLKEGLCEANTPRELLLEACRFYSTESDSLVSLEEYVSRMKDGQEHIYFLTGDRLETLRHDPKLEGFKKRGVEVLLFTDHVDDFWVNVAGEYQGKALKSITRSDIDLSAFRAESADDDAAPEQEKMDDSAIQMLTDRMKEILGDQVEAVRATDKLTDSAACLAVGAAAMDIRLERFLLEQKQLPRGTAKILEINPAHPVVKKLAEHIASEGKDAEVADITWLLLDQARITEGEPIHDPAAFSRRLNAFIGKAMVA